MRGRRSKGLRGAQWDQSGVSVSIGTEAGAVRMERRDWSWELFKKQNGLDLVTEWLWGQQGDSQLSFWSMSLGGQQCHGPGLGILRRGRFRDKAKSSDLPCLV